MKLVKKTAEYSIYQRRDNRYAVKSAAKKAINGEDKVKILLAESLITAPEPKAPEPEAAEEEAEAPAEDAAEDSAAEAEGGEEESKDE